MDRPRASHGDDTGGDRTSDAPRLARDPWVHSFLRYLRNERDAADNTLASYLRDILAFGDHVRGQQGGDDGGSDGEEPVPVDWGSVDGATARAYLIKLARAGLARSSLNRKTSALRVCPSAKRVSSTVSPLPLVSICWVTSLACACASTNANQVVAISSESAKAALS